jgi:fatty acid CoA ligase FadD36
LRDNAAGTGIADRPDAIVVGDTSMSRAELATAADAFAARIGGAPAVAIRADPSLPAIVAIVGGLVAGVPVVPLPPDAGPDETAYMLADSGATLLVRDSGAMARPYPWRWIASRGPRPHRPARPTPGTALVLYTSGTTGRPMGVELGPDAIAANLDALAGAWAWTADDTLVHGLPLSTCMASYSGADRRSRRLDRQSPLRLGCRLVHTMRPTPTAYAAARGTLYFGVPTVWSRMCAEPNAARALSAARLLVSGSVPLPRPVFERLTAFAGQKPIERYGMTESLIVCSTRADGER